MRIPGLVVVPDFVSEAEERHLLTCIGAPTPYSHGRVVEKHRERVLRYGPGVPGTGYDSGTVILELPAWLAELARRIEARGLWDRVPNAITVNEYLPTQCIDFHTDRKTSGAVISTLSLSGHATMAFRDKHHDRGEVFEVPAPPRTLIQMTGACRNEPWRHAIYPVTELRYSIVFRWAKILEP